MEQKRGNKRSQKGLTNESNIKTKIHQKNNSNDFKKRLQSEEDIKTKNQSKKE
jgi:hypothetical protein